MKILLLLFSVLSSVSLFGAPKVKSVLVRQLWPWSKNIRIEYTLTGVTGRVDVSLAAEYGGKPIEDSLLASAWSGDVYDVSGAHGVITLDSAKIFGDRRINIDDFTVTLSIAEASSASTEVLYRIFDLTGGGHEDVTRGALLSRRYGDVETDFAEVGRHFGVEGFNTSLEDVVIWTGVTNDVRYKTTHLVMRKIPAKGRSFNMGCRADDYFLDKNVSTAPLHEVSFTNDYFIAVFELTEGQVLSVITNSAVKSAGGSLSSASSKMRFTNELYRYQRPINMTDVFSRYKVANWPWEPKKGAFDINTDTFVGNLRMLTGEVGFDHPTESFWEYACRAGTESTFNSGLNTADASHMNAISRSVLNSNCNHTNYNPPSSVEAMWTPDEGASAIVGSYAPNAWGLYDMHGNMMEWCLDHYSADPTGYDGYTKVDPWGPKCDNAGVDYSETAAQRRLYHVGRGGAFWYSAQYNTSSSRADYYTNNSNTSYGGVRLCITVFD